jgi:hypothetical protein
VSALLASACSDDIGAMERKLNPPKSSVTIRVDAKVLSEIEHAATEERRSISNVLRIAIEDWVRGRRQAQQGRAA